MSSNKPREHERAQHDRKHRMSVKISVIIPTFNRGYCLERAIESVRNQTFQSIELLVVDDGSTDNTRALIQQYNYPIRYFYQQNQGVSAARNLGIKESRGEWIALLDSDDAWHPLKCEKQWQALLQHPRLKICHTNEAWYRNHVFVNPHKKHQKYGGDIYERCLPLCAMSPSSVIIHQSVFDAVGDFDVTLPACEDYDLWLRITARYPVLYLDEKLTLKYGGHPDQLSQQYWGMDRFRIRSLLSMLKSGMLTQPQAEKTRQQLIRKMSILNKGALKHRNGDLLAQLDEIQGELNPLTTLDTQ